jgi:hypothetical protein
MTSVTLHIFAPDMIMPMEPIEQYVESGGTGSHEMIIENVGPGRLTWSMVANVDNKTAPVVKLADVEPLGFRIADPDKTGIEEPYYPEVLKGSGGPDAFGYTWIDSDESGGPMYSWVDITSTGTQVSLGDDDAEGPIALGFNIPFYENAYSEIYISSNGVLSFGGGVTTVSNTAIPDSDAPNNMIPVWWDDLDPTEGGAVYYYYDASSARFIVSWVGVPNYHYSGGTGSLTFQAILYANGLITLQYGVMDPGDDAAGLAGATIGIENSNGTDGLQVVHNAAYMHDQLAINFLGATPWWLSVEPMGGTIDPGEADTVQVLFDASELPDGTYTGDVMVSTNDPEYQVFSIPVTMYAGVSEPIVTGDMNGDGVVNVTDAVSLIAFVFASGPPPDPMECGDCNCDGLVNVSDITYLLNYIFGDGTPPCEH